MKVSLALINGKIRTMDGRCEEAVAVADDKIIKVGTTWEINKLADDKTEVIDLKGKTVLPGFIDTHGHLVGYGFSLNAIDLSNAKSIEEIIDSCRKYIEKKQIKPGEWILGRGWNQNNFIYDKIFPTKKDLDKISTDNPVLLIRTCGHIGIVNSLALRDARVTKDTYIEGGAFDKDENEEPNGVIREASLEWFKKNSSYKPNKAAMKKAILDGANELLKYGVTSIHTEDSYDLGYSGSFKEIYDTYEDMVANNELPIRVYQKISLPKKADIEKFLEGNLRTGDGNNYYKIGPMKQWCDGTMGARTAALLEDYNDDPGNKGILVYTYDELYENVELAHKEGMQVCLHAIGDAALAMVLDVYERVLRELPRDARHRIVHCQVGNLSLYERLAKLDVSINIQPIQVGSDWPMMNARLGWEREKECHAWRTLSDLGVCITGSSDIPVDTPNVFYGIHSIVNRKDIEGKPENGWLPKEKVTVEEALKIYTINSAYSAFEEKIKGTITEGKLADMIIIDKDPFEVEPKELMHIEVEKTIVGGKIKY